MTVQLNSSPTEVTVDLAAARSAGGYPLAVKSGVFWEAPQRHLALAALVGLCVACDFLMAPIFTTVFQGPLDFRLGIAFAALGCTLAQGNVLAAWLAWDSWPFLDRLIRHWGIAEVLCFVWACGLFVAQTGDFFEIYVRIALAVPLVSLAAQFPAWIVRQLYGWRLTRDEGETAKPLTIRGLMLGTLIVAASLALARMQPGFVRQNEMWLLSAFAAAATGIISTIGVLPAGALMLRKRPLVRALVYSGLYAALWIGFLWAIVAILWWYAPAALAPLAAYFALSCLMLSYGATLVLTAVVGRAYGYQLVWRRRRRLDQLTGSAR